jgi:hypothetical protein
MVSDFFYPQPGGVESHIYQLSTVCPTNLRNSYVLSGYLFPFDFSFWINILSIEFLELSNVISQFCMIEKLMLGPPTETHRPRPPSNNHHARLWRSRLSKQDRSPLPYQPSKSLPHTSLACLPQHYFPNRLLIFPSAQTDLHPGRH